MRQLSLQKQYAPDSICFGCGPKNTQGLQIESFVEGENVIAQFIPKPHYHAFPSVLNGGIIGSILDCHCNWSACYYLMIEQNLSSPPTCVTAEYSVKLRKPTPLNITLDLVASLISIEGKKVNIKAQMKHNDIIYAEFSGLFINVPKDHPAYQRQ